MLGRLKSFLGLETKASSATIVDPMLLSIGGETASGAFVSPETAMRNPAVLCCVRAIAEAVGSTPMNMYRRTPGDGRELATDHPLWPLLTCAPNDFTPVYEFKLLMTQDFCLYGNAFAWVSRDNDGTIIELIRLLPSRVVVYVDPLTLAPEYHYTGLDGVTHIWSRSEVLHLRGVGAVALGRGDSPIDLAREAIGTAVVLEAYAAGLFGRGARPAGVLKGSGKMTDDVMKRLRVSFEGIYKGGSNAGRTAILEDGWDFLPLQLSSTDAQFIEMRKFQVQEISRVFRVPLHLLSELDNVHYSTAEAFGQQFLSFCLLPIYRMWRDAIHLTLLSAEERQEYYIDWDTDHIARADLAARMQAYSVGIMNGIFNPNECRAQEGLGPYQGGEVFQRPVNQAAVATGAPADPAVALDEGA